MLPKQILDQIIFSCDEALKESFLKRMEIALRSAEDMVGRGAEPSVYDRELEKSILEHASFGLTPELSNKARSLWQTLLRMSRERQYKYLTENVPGLVLSHEADITRESGKRPVLCPLGVEREVSMALREEVDVCPSTNAVLNGILEQPDARGAVVVDSLYNTEWLYSAIFDRHIYVNEVCPTPGGEACILMSQRLLPPGGDQIVSVVFSLPEEHGALTQSMGVFTDYRVNIEFFRMRNIRNQHSHLKNLIFVDLEGDLMSPGVRAALLQLEKELPFFRVIGWRKSV